MDAESRWGNWYNTPRSISCVTSHLLHHFVKTYRSVTRSRTTIQVHKCSFFLFFFNSTLHISVALISFIWPQAYHPLFGGRCWLKFIEEIHMNNTVAIICSKMQNLQQIFQWKFEENVDWVMCHVFFAVPCCKRYFARWIFDLGG